MLLEYTIYIKTSTTSYEQNLQQEKKFVLELSRGTKLWKVPTIKVGLHKNRASIYLKSSRNYTEITLPSHITVD